MSRGDDEPTRAAGRTGIVAELRAAGFEDAVEVGRGGFGTVYRCVQSSLLRPVAVKVLSSDLDHDNRERFIREGHAMGKLSGHPNIVSIIQVGVTSTGRPYIVMPFHSRDSLAVHIRKFGPLPWQQAVRVGVKLAGALETAHRCNTLHRDVKPANILLTDYGEPQLTDFGIARIEGGFETATGAFTGSLAYTAPEVLKGLAPTPSADVYGLGATVFALIAGRAAYERRSGEEIVAQYLRITTQPIPDLRPAGVPDDVCAVVERAMAELPQDRQASAAAFGEELRAVQRAHGLAVDEMAVPVGGEQPGGDVTALSLTDMLRFDEAPPPPDTDGPTGTVRFRSGATADPQRSPGRRAGGPATGSTSVAGAARPQPPTGAPTTSPPHHTAPPRPPAPAATGGRRSPVVLIALAVVVTLAVAAAGFWYLGRGGQDDTAGPGTDPVPAAVAWQDVRPAPLARQQTASAVLDGTVWVFGGLDDDGATAAVEGYEPAINTWKAGPDLPAALHHAMAVAFDGELVVLGGWEADGGNLTARVSGRVLALRGGQWMALPPLNHPRAGGAAVVAGGAIVVFGGQADGELVPQTEVFDGTRWTDAADIPTPREHLGAATDGDYAYAVGGRALSSDANTAAFERFDPATGTWQVLADLPAPRGGLAAAFVDGRVAAVGGEEPTQALATGEAYDLRTGTWSTLPPLPTARHGLALAAVGGTLYAVGGGTRPTHTASTTANQMYVVPPRPKQPVASWRPTREARVARQQTGTTVLDGTVWVLGGIGDAGAATAVQGYEPAVDSWKAGPDLPVALNHLAAATYRGELVAIGGWVPEGANLSATASDRVLALRDGRWLDLPPLNHARAGHAAVVVGDAIVVFGGQADGRLVTQTEVFDGTAWTVAASLPTPREHLAAATDGQYAYAVGGRALSSDANTAALERFDPGRGVWVELADMPTPRGGLGAAFLDNRVVAVGGEEPTQVLGTVEVFDVATGVWSPAPSLGTARHGLSVAAVGDSVYAVGGADRPTHAGSVTTSEALDFR